MSKEVNARSQADWRYKGKPIKRLEDPRFLNGSAQFIDDLRLPGMLYVAFLRSPYAHARIKGIDTSRAERFPGVVDIVTGEDAKRLTGPIRAHTGIEHRFNEYCMAIDKVTYEGHVVAAVAAKDKYTAADAVELIEVTYEPLPPVVDAEAAAKPDSPPLFEEAGTNIVWHDHLKYGDVDGAFKNAEVTVSEELLLHRYSSTPIERFGCICSYDKSANNVTIWSNNSGSGFLMRQIAGALRIPESKIRLIMPDIGGSYGNKISIPNVLISTILSMKAGKPVKYIETERESMMGLAHACNGKFYVEAAGTRNGIITALRTKEFWDEGASTLKAGIHPFNKLSIATGCYKIPALELDAYSVLTNKCPSAPNRAVGKPGMALMLERLVDLLAAKLGIDKAEIRFRNFIQPHEFPYTTPTGNTYDSGNYPESLKIALEKIGYEELRKKQAELRKQGRYIGIGIASVVQSGTHSRVEVMLSYPNAHLAPASEAATVKMDASGMISVAIGSPCTGQGHETVIAQIVADELGVDIGDVNVSSGFDSETHPWTRFGGRFSNKFSCVDSGAILYAARNLRSRIMKIAAHKLGVREDDLEIVGEKVQTRSKAKSISIKEICEAAYGDPKALPEGVPSGLVETYVYVSPYPRPPDKDKKFQSHVTFASSVHIPVVEVDMDTGSVKIIRYVIVEDCGNVINPLIVEGQVHGSALHGISAALGEEFIYDENGQLLTTTFMDYMKPTIVEAPFIELEHICTPSPFTPLGTKGVGESGSIPPPAALVSAVEDALAPFHVKINRLPLTPENMLKIIRQSQASSAP